MYLGKGMHRVHVLRMCTYANNSKWSRTPPAGAFFDDQFNVPATKELIISLSNGDNSNQKEKLLPAFNKLRIYFKSINALNCGSRPNWKK